MNERGRRGLSGGGIGRKYLLFAQKAEGFILARVLRGAGGGLAHFGRGGARREKMWMRM